MSALLMLLGAAGPVHAEATSGWIAPLTALRATPLDPLDTTRALADRLAMIRALGRYGVEADAVALLLAVLAAGESSLVRVEAVQALARRGTPHAVEALAAELDPTASRFDAAVAEQAAYALAAIGTREAFEALGRARKEPRVAASADGALAWLDAHLSNSPPAASADTDARARAGAVRVATPATCADARVGGAEFEDPAKAPDALLLAATCVAGVVDPALRRQMRRALRAYDDLRLRVAGAWALALTREHGARPALVAALADAAPELRLAAVRALAALGGARALAALSEHARVERDVGVLREARRAVEVLATGATLPLDAAGLDLAQLPEREANAQPGAE